MSLHPDIQASMDLSLEELNHQLSPSQTAKDANGVLTAMVQATETALAHSGHQVFANETYGARARQKLDVFAPLGAKAAPCFVFIHGGFWQEGAKEVSGFAAQAFTDAGWAYVSVGYTLTPGVTLTELTQEIAEALAHLQAHAGRYGIDPKGIILAGHSAGGHLTACMLADVLGRGSADLIAGAVLVSGVFELAPIAKSYVNDLSRITDAEIAQLSPARFKPARDVPVHVLIGGDEPDAFQVQSTALAALWQPHISDLTEAHVPGKDHFDILDALSDPASETFQTIQNMIPRP